MYEIGVDVGSTYTKYCIMHEKKIVDLFMEKTPIKQADYFREKIQYLKEMYNGARIVSCGYGKENVETVKRVNELTALSKGAFYFTKVSGTILDIGGQDTKIIYQDNGNLMHFFVNDKCAAGSGMFLINVLNMLEKDFSEIDLEGELGDIGNLTSVCAVFAQSEIVQMIADNFDVDTIVRLVVKQILIKAKVLLNKIDTKKINISGGLSQIKGIDIFASNILEVECRIIKEGMYSAAVGCALIADNLIYQ